MSEVAYKTWEEMTTLEQYACTYWDMYKDAFGIRPRGIDTSSWSEADYLVEFKELEEIIEREHNLRKGSEARAMHDFEMRMQDLLRCGAKDREMAMRWIHEAEGSNGDDEYLCYCVGLPYGYFRKAA